MRSRNEFGMTWCGKKNQKLFLNKSEIPKRVRDDTM